PGLIVVGFFGEWIEFLRLTLFRQPCFLLAHRDQEIPVAGVNAGVIWLEIRGECELLCGTDAVPIACEAYLGKHGMGPRVAGLELDCLQSHALTLLQSRNMRHAPVS